MRVRSMAVGGVISIALLGSVATIVPASAITSTADVTVTPSANLHDKQVVTVKGSGFEDNHPVYLGECNGNIVTSLSAADCDVSTLVTGQTSKTGTFSLKVTVEDGKDYVDNGYGKCDSGDPCVVGAIDSITGAPTDYGFKSVTFAPAISSKVALKASAKSAKVGKTVKLVVTTSAAKSNGSFVGTARITDNGKKAGTAKVSSAGKATYSFKLKHKGKQKVVVSYAGNGNYKSAKSKTLTVTGK